MKSISMTIEQTERYDTDDLSVMSEMREQAKRIREGNEVIEIYTADGIIVDVIQHPVDE